MHASLSAFLGSLFVLLAGTNVWSMLHASQRATDRRIGARLMWVHRVAGYAFVFLFCAMCFFMALRLKGVDEELPSRVVLHLLLVLLLAPILLVKVLIARYYKQYSSALLPLGVTIFVLSFALVSINLVPYFLGRARSGGVPAPLSAGFLSTLCIGVGVLLFRRPRPVSHAVSTGASRHRGDTPSAASSPAHPPATVAPSIRLRLARIDVQSHDAKTLRFLLLDGTRVVAHPGQFLTFQWQIDGTVVPRSYSLSSSPCQTAYVDITPKRIPNGQVSSFLNQRAAIGLVVEARGPFGRFYFDEERDRRIVLIAGGSGITPMMSMLRYIDDHCLSTPVTLLYGVRTRNDIIFEDELDRLRRRLANFRMVVILSQPDAAWCGPRGRLNRDLIAAVEGLPASTFFVCGPPPFMENVCEILRSLDVDLARIRRESFGSAARAEGGREPDASTSFDRTVEFARSGKRCTADPGQTVLELAEMHGVDIPSACRQGRCGTCTTRLLEGDVDMEVEEGLEPSARAEGCILPCVARPRGFVKVDA